MGRNEQRAADAKLGAFVTERRAHPSWLMFAAVVVIVPLLLPLGNMALPGYSRQMGPVAWAVAGPLMALGVGALVWYWPMRVRFYALGAVRVRGGRELARVRYDELDAMTYRVKRRTSHGITVGFMLEMKLRAGDGRTISYSGPYKANVSEAMSTLYSQGGTYEELDDVRDAAAAAIARRGRPDAVVVEMDG